MTGTLTLTLLLLMAAVIAALVVLVIYLVDRVNGLERATKDMLGNLQGGQPARPSGPYAGLSGKPLWDALTGEADTPLDELTLDGVRKRYRLVLGEHIGFVFKEGASDQSKGFDAVPPPTRQVRTPTAQVESWLPPEAVEAVYRCGQGYTRNDPAELPGLRQRLDQVCADLHVRAGLEVLQPASAALMPPKPAAPAPAPAAAPQTGTSTSP